VKRVFGDLQQRLPIWRRQLSEFSQTPPGKATLVVAAILLISSGAIWQLLHLVWLL
jgi:hypothetical protein